MDHNGPQVNPTTTTSNRLINEAGSLCSSDSVEEGNEIEEQSGRRIQRQISQSQRGKAKTVLVENNLSTASFTNSMSFANKRKKKERHTIITASHYIITTKRTLTLILHDNNN